MAPRLSLKVMPWIAACLPVVAAIAIEPRPQAKPTLVYEGEVQTTLSAHCGICHKGDTARATLDLTTFQTLMKGGLSGRVVIPGDAENSLLVQRLEGRGGREQMPMGFKPLAPEKIKAVRDWIDAGCKSSGGPIAHWAYVPPKKPPLPAVKDSKWCRNPIDRFILARLEKEGLRPLPEASKSTLIRRLYLDLTGLPPSPENVEVFLKDTSKGAYDKVVDSLLARPQYGEHMARPWLDLARYADSDGYEKDLNRTAWKYRDWVIDAFNKNMRFDEFTVEQLAGDLLPKPTLDQLVATGFNRNSMFNTEGGVDQAEAHFNVVLDRVNTTSTVFLGSTIQCARCHDHKYDPFTQKDFYKLCAVFDNGVVNKVGDNKIGEEKWTEPVMSVPSPEQAAKKKKLEAEALMLETALKSPGPEVESGFQNWIRRASEPRKWIGVSATATSQAGQNLEKQADGSFLATSPVPANDVYVVTMPGPYTGVTGIRLEVLPDKSFPKGGPGRAVSGNFELTKVEVSSDRVAVKLVRATTSFTQNGYDAQTVIPGDINNGWAVYNAYGQPNELLLEPEKPVDTAEGQVLTLVLRFESKQWPEHVIGRFRVTLTTESDPFVVPSSLKAMLGDPSKIAANRAALLAEYEKTSPLTRDKVARRSEVQKVIDTLNGQIPTALVLQEKPSLGPLKGNIHVRGEFLQKGEEIESGPPAVLTPKPGPAPFNRLTLARWLVSRQNPLTARVEVNRLWEHVYGRGIVETSEDFGSQGAKPTHPDLLDWLAVTFMDTGWDTKALLRTIVTSATYRQSSDATKNLIERDPLNLLMGRAPRHRLDAEEIRDNMLAIGGLLNQKVGGPSVYPSQPPAIWDTPYNGQQWMESKGEDKYRRGLYTFWKRSAPYPSFLAMDATSRETCTVRRIRSNTPLQALALLNDEVSMDAAKGLAKQMAAMTGGPGAKISRGFVACTGRGPNPDELKRLVALHGALRDKYEKDGEAARKLADSAESAALVMVANTLLNLDETISRT